MDRPRPETRFAWNGDVSLAYQVCGDGPTDLVYLQGYCSNVDVNWESPSLSRFLRGLASHARLIVSDRRGWGCSERFTQGDVPDVDILTDDVLAVLKAVRSERATIMATTNRRWWRRSSRPLTLSALDPSSSSIPR